MLISYAGDTEFLLFLLTTAYKIRKLSRLSRTLQVLLQQFSYLLSMYDTSRFLLTLYISRIRHRFTNKKKRIFQLGVKNQSTHVLIVIIFSLN